MDAAHSFYHILRLSDQEEEERINRLLRDLMGDEYQLNDHMKALIDAQTYVFPAFNQENATPDTLIRTQHTISAKKHHYSTATYFHRHDFIEIIYVYRGTCHQYIETRDQLIHLRQGDLFVLNQQVLHALYQPHPDDIIIKIIIPPKYIALDMIEAQTSNGSIFNFLANSVYEKNNSYHYLHFRTMSHPLIKLFIERMMSEYYLKALSHEDAIGYYLGLLFIELGRSNTLLRDIHFEMKFNRLQHEELLSYMRTNMHCITLEQLASEFSYNKCYLSRLISEQFGEGFQKLIRDMRMEKIESLLRSTNLSMEDIATRVGYQNAVTIYKLFREKHHITPAKYRKQMKA